MLTLCIIALGYVGAVLALAQVFRMNDEGPDVAQRLLMSCDGQSADWWRELNENPLDTHFN